MHEASSEVILEVAATYRRHAVGLLALGASSEVHPELAATRTTGAPAGDSTPCRRHAVGLLALGASSEVHPELAATRTTGARA